MRKAEQRRQPSVSLDDNVLAVLLAVDRDEGLGCEESVVRDRLCDRERVEAHLKDDGEVCLVTAAERLGQPGVVRVEQER